MNIMLAFISLALMTLSYTFKRPSMGIGAAMCWLIFGIYNLTNSVANWDIYYDLFVVGALLFIVALLECMIFRPKADDEEPEEQLFWDRQLEEYNKNKQLRNERLQTFRQEARRIVKMGQESEEEDYDRVGRN